MIDIYGFEYSLMSDEVYYSINSDYVRFQNTDEQKETILGDFQGTTIKNEFRARLEGSLELALEIDGSWYKLSNQIYDNEYLTKLLLSTPINSGTGEFTEKLYVFYNVNTGALGLVGKNTKDIYKSCNEARMLRIGLLCGALKNSTKWEPGHLYWSKTKSTYCLGKVKCSFNNEEKLVLVPKSSVNPGIGSTKEAFENLRSLCLVELKNSGRAIDVGQVLTPDLDFLDSLKKIKSFSYFLDLCYYYTPGKTELQDIMIELGPQIKEKIKAEALGILSYSWDKPIVINTTARCAVRNVFSVWDEKEIDKAMDFCDMFDIKPEEICKKILTFCQDENNFTSNFEIYKRYGATRLRLTHSSKGFHPGQTVKIQTQEFGNEIAHAIKNLLEQAKNSLSGDGVHISKRNRSTKNPLYEIGISIFPENLVKSEKDPKKAEFLKNEIMKRRLYIISFHFYNNCKIEIV